MTVLQAQSYQHNLERGGNETRFSSWYCGCRLCGCDRGIAFATICTYLPTFSRSNVKLETAGIHEITESGIRTVDGTYFEVDVIIFATGFEVAEITTDAQIIGLNGQELYKQWQEHGMEAFKGASISGFPNFNFLLIRIPFNHFTFATRILRSGIRICSYALPRPA
jgi:cation diffusion facilitator CzcD-associated flavoprotein CzcO